MNLIILVVAISFSLSVILAIIDAWKESRRLNNDKS